MTDNDRRNVGFPVKETAFFAVAIIQAFVLRAWMRRREYSGDRLDDVSHDNFREEMKRWMDCFVNMKLIHAYQVVYDESVWPPCDEGAYSNAVVLFVRTTKVTGFYAINIRLDKPLMECTSSANPDASPPGVDYNVFDVTFEVDHEGTSKHVKKVVGSV